MWDIIIHKWLRVPYTLHVSVNRKVKKPKATVIFIHGIGHSGDVWRDVIAKLPSDIKIINIDLLGFGKSPKPHWPIYSVRLQARAFIATVLGLRINGGPFIIVGHSLGALVAVEIARRYPLLVRSLILCSPPFYKQDLAARKLLPHSDTVLKDIYTAIHKYPGQFLKISALAVKYGLVNKSFNVTEDDVHSYMGALEASIINQTSLQDATKLRKRMRIIHGALDPVVIGKNLKSLVKKNDRATLDVVLAGHEITGLYVPAVIKAIDRAAARKPKTPKALNKVRRGHSDV
ncbi:MAG TPA: alpha/beta fold hydrolase [Candidatus Saccharimonadales bacterium]|jgi:pimeloyl-ACP methyl ester carboxylesterase|nr:alpha/beta fold hydrolase [Candidatus Saccharimonadales bacterium]